MTTRFACLTPLVVCLIVGLSAAEAHAKDTSQPRVRPLDPSLIVIVNVGSQRSATFHALVDRLETGDVVVYVQYGQLPSGLQGRLVFLSQAAGFRYVMVEVARDLDAPRLVTIVGHELRHAVEILDQPEIVSQATFATAYERSGFRRRHFADGAVGFDTHAAVDVGRQVWRELAGSAVTLATR